jgi:sigma-B regulation protein RsbU (phosphoserine phosphatase)
MDGAPSPGDPDQVDLRTLLSHSKSVPATTTVEALQGLFTQSGVEFLAVLEGERLVGMCSRHEMAQKLSSRYGFALYARQPVTTFLMPAPLFISVETPITEVFRAASRREARDFYDDVALVEAGGRYLGMISMPMLVRLQTDFLLRNIDNLEASRQEIAAKNRALEEDLLMAREVQLAMQPQAHSPLSSAGLTLRLAHRYRPSGSVGGDFFDVLRISDHAAGIFICDVMGHGVRSALITAMIRAMLEELRPKAADPGILLTHLNRDLTRILRQAHGLIFVTAAYAVIHLGFGRLRYAQAGHPTPLRWNARTRKVRPVACAGDASGPALGLIDDAEYTTVDEAFSEGDRLALFTDGLFEAADGQGAEFGPDRLIEAFERHADLDLGDGLDAVLADVARFSGDRFGDDVCLVGAELNPSSAGSNPPLASRNVAQ